MRRHRVIGVYDLCLGAAALFSIWSLLPDRCWPVDVVGTTLGVALLGVGLALCVGAAWAPRAAAMLALILSVGGVLLVGALAMTAGQLAGMYGPVGLGGSAILTFVLLLLFPYLVVFPAAQAYVLLGGARREG